MLKFNLFFCSTFLFFISTGWASNLAEQKVIIVNNSEVICNGRINERFWVCHGEKYRGFIDHKSLYDNYPFTAYVFADYGVDAKVHMTSIDDGREKKEVNLLFS